MTGPTRRPCVAQQPSPGTLVAVGGAEDKAGEMRILRRALDHVHGEARRIAIIPTASNEPREAARPYLPAFRDLGATEVEVLDIRTRDDALREEFAQRALHADVLYMTGGDQVRLASILGGTPILEAMHEKLATGGVVAGTSAGAAAMSGTMIAQGTSALRKGGVQLTTGLGLLPGVIVDTHFAERGRFGRLIEAVALDPDLLGLGLSEDTAVVVRGDQVEVVGAGSIVLLDGREMRSTNAPYVDKDHPLSVERMIIHTLAEGHCFKLDSRHVLPLRGQGKARA